MRTFTFSIYTLLFFCSSFGQTKNGINFQAKIENRNWDYLYIKDANYNTVQIIDIDTDGLFKATLNIQDGIYLLFDGVEYFKIYLKKGYNLQLTMNTNNFRESIVFTGIGAEENNYLAKESIFEVNYNYGILSNAKTPKKTQKLIEEKEKTCIQMLKNNTSFDKTFVDLEIGFYKNHSEELKKYYGELREMN
ncbi:hypothetical protein [Flavobacterium sp. IMCC34518]|uniref:hypothetical protein n=1 Tax=Flavobacterium sp. IMCC34518 TaxID=3003623 RepID=UPI0022ABD9BF|nr:hypothetical protein [Flavobacterium sp. IMCC34518]